MSVTLLQERRMLISEVRSFVMIVISIMTIVLIVVAGVGGFVMIVIPIMII